MVWQPEFDDFNYQRQLTEQVGGAFATYRAEIESAPDPEAKGEEIERHLPAIASPFRTAEAFNIEDILDPGDTRPILCDFIEMAREILKTQLGPSYRP